ncbi:MAG: hypothetical protein ACEPOW_03375 [Bacteroidales bacterium]
MKRCFLCFVFAVISILSVNAQEYKFPEPIKAVADSRNKTIEMILDYRFKGGHWAFQKLFYKNFVYPEAARNACAIGISIINITVNCSGQLENVVVKNSLGYGVELEIKKVLSLPEAEWNSCKDDKYTRFEIPILFVTQGTQTNRVDPYIVVEGENPGFVCKNDKYYWDRAVKYLKKKKGKKAISYLDILIKRNPMTTEFFEIKKQAIKMMK